MLSPVEPLSDADMLKTYSEYLPDEPGEDTGEPVILRLGAIHTHTMIRILSGSRNASDADSANRNPN
jgi:hypothetical protein